ncbi:MAG TPA: hypothetical protein VMU75_01150 [Acidimicrobiales bacterium]|nr:hypothetical protein [Acidimicrobiales bacterium]
MKILLEGDPRGEKIVELVPRDAPPPREIVVQDQFGYPVDHRFRYVGIRRIDENVVGLYRHVQVAETWPAPAPAPAPVQELGELTVRRAGTPIALPAATGAVAPVLPMRFISG